MSNKVVSVLALIVAGVAVAEMPWVEKTFLIPITDKHPHLAVLAEGITSAVLVWWAAKKEGFTPGGKYGK